MAGAVFVLVLMAGAVAGAQTNTGEISGVLDGFKVTDGLFNYLVIFGTPNFGRIFGAKPPREMQFGVKVSFSRDWTRAIARTAGPLAPDQGRSGISIGSGGVPAKNSMASS